MFTRKINRHLDTCPKCCVQMLSRSWNVGNYLYVRQRYLNIIKFDFLSDFVITFELLEEICKRGNQFWCKTWIEPNNFIR
jgi:hypothetical protein